MDGISLGQIFVAAMPESQGHKPVPRQRRSSRWAVHGALGLATALALCLGSTPAEAGNRRAAAERGGSGLQEDFYMQSLNIQTQRQGGSTVDLFFAVSYRPAEAGSRGQVNYPDYRLLVKLLQPLKEPTKDFPTNALWEALAGELVRRLLSEPSVDGATVQLRVHPSCDIKEGDHSPRHHWRAAMASAGDAPVLAFVPNLTPSPCQRQPVQRP